MRLAKEIGVNRPIAGMHWPGMETAAATDAMRRFVEAVVPRVREALQAARAR